MLQWFSTLQCWAFTVSGDADWDSYIQHTADPSWDTARTKSTYCHLREELNTGAAFAQFIKWLQSMKVRHTVWCHALTPGWRRCDTFRLLSVNVLCVSASLFDTCLTYIKGINETGGVHRWQWQWYLSNSIKPHWQVHKKHKRNQNTWAFLLKDC